jgi:hypothetical protein
MLPRGVWRGDVAFAPLMRRSNLLWIVLQGAEKKSGNDTNQLHRSPRFLI